MGGGCGRQAAKSLGRYIECVVELAGEVLEGDEAGKLNDCVVVELLLDPCHQVVIHMTFRMGHGLGVLQGYSFGLVEKRALLPFPQGLDLVIRNPTLHQGRRVDVNAELTVVDLGDPDRDQGS